MLCFRKKDRGVKVTLRAQGLLRVGMLVSSDRRETRVALKQYTQVDKTYHQVGGRYAYVMTDTGGWRFLSC